jgi:hypothetical protein
MNFFMVLNLDGSQIRPNIDCPVKSSGVGDLAPLTTDSNQVDAKDFEIRATLLSDSFGAFANHDSSVVDSASLLCSACGAETLSGDSFCQECGAAQPSSEGLDSRACVTYRNHSIDPSNAPSNDSSRDFFDSFADRLIQSVSNNPKLIALVAVAVVIGVVGVTMLATFFRLPAELNSALKENQLNRAATLAEKLMLSRFGALSGDDAELYSTAFHKRAQVFAGNRNFKLAFADLVRVLPSYSRIGEVEQLKASYALFVSQSSEVAQSKIEAAGQDKGKTASVETSLPRGNSGRSNPRALEPTKTGDINSPVKSIAAKPLAATQSNDNQEPSTNSTKEEVNSDTEEADMAAYNRRLADYFSQPAPEHTKGDSAKDPPSFSEWVQSGKADF